MNGEVEIWRIIKKKSKKNYTSTSNAIDKMLGGSMEESEVKENTTGVEILPGQTENGVKRGRPRTNYREVVKSSQQGLREGDTRATFIVNEDKLRKLKALTLIEGKPIKEIIDDMLSEFLEDKEVPAYIYDILDKQEKNKK